MIGGTTNGGYFIPDELWAAEIKENLFPALMDGYPHMRWLVDEFPHGDQVTIPTTGRMTVRSYTEGDEITVEDPTLNEIVLTINKYYQSGIALTDKFKQDTHIAEMAMSTWRRDTLRKLSEKIEADVHNTVNTDAVNGHTAADDNDIGGIDHRWAASGTSQIFDYADFRHAKYVFDKGNVQKAGRVFVIDPKPVHDLLASTAGSTAVLAQDVYGSNTFLKDGFGLGAYVGRFFGFEVFDSNLLSTMDSETLPKYGVTATAALTSPVVNMAYGEEALFGCFRQNVEIEQFRDYIRKQDVIHACVRFGNRVYRPESVVAVLSV